MNFCPDFQGKSRITILYGFISLLINQLSDPIGAYSTPLSVAWWGKQVMRRGRSHPHPHLGGAPAPSQTPPFTWGGIRPPHTTQKVGLWPPHLMLLGDGCGWNTFRKENAVVGKLFVDGKMVVGKLLLERENDFVGHSKVTNVIAEKD